MSIPCRSALLRRAVTPSNGIPVRIGQYDLPSGIPLLQNRQDIDAED